MKNKIIIEEIRRINEIMGINPDNFIFEATGNWLLDLVEKGGVKSEEFFVKLRSMTGKDAEVIIEKIKKISKNTVLSLEEKMFAIQVVRNLFPKMISDMVESFEVRFKPDVLQSIIKNGLLNPKLSVAEVRDMIEKGTGVKMSEEGVAIWRDRVVNIEGEIKLPSKNFKERATDFGKEAWNGFKVTQGGKLFARWAGKKLFWLIGQSKRLEKLTMQEKKIVGGWFLTGVGDFSQIKTIFKNYGILEGLYLVPANVGGQFVSKWCFWTGVFTVTNVLINYWDDLDEERFDNEFIGLLTRLEEGFETAGFHWMFPALIVNDNFIKPLNKGGMLKSWKEDYRKKIERMREKANKNIKSIETKVEESKPVQVAKKVINKVTGKSDIVPGSYESFEEFCKNQNPPLVPDVEDKENIGIYSVNGIEYTWNAAEKTFKK